MILASPSPLIADAEALRARAKTSPAARFPTFYSAVLELRPDPPPRDACS